MSQMSMTMAPALRTRMQARVKQQFFSILSSQVQSGFAASKIVCYILCSITEIYKPL